MEILRKIVVVYIFLLMPFFIMAQSKNTSLTLEDLIPGGNTSYRFYPKDLYGLQWRGENVSYYDIENEALVNKTSKTFSEELHLSLVDVNKALGSSGLKEVRSLYDISFPDENKILIHTPQYYAIYEDGNIIWKIEADRNRKNDDFCVENRTLAYTIDNNLWIANQKGVKAITSEPEGIECGKTVHRNEFGISKGTYWSPTGKYLAFYRMDERMVTDYPLVDISARVGKLKNTKYPMAGMTSHQVTVGIYALSTGKTIYLDVGDPTDRYFTNIAWSPDETKIYMIELNRDQNHAQLVRYDAETGEKEAVLIEETHPKYVEPQYPILFVKGNDKQFIYQSQKDGFNHLYLYDTEGKLIRQLTQGEWIVQEVLGFDEKGKNLFFVSTENSPLESHLYKVNINTGKRVLLTKDPGVHNVQISPSGRYAIDKYSSSEIPNIIKVIDTDKGKDIHTLLIADNPYKEYNMPSVEVGTIKAADGETDLYYRLVKPTNFDPSKKYPVIVYVYGGPHLQLIQNRFNWGARGWDLYMAQQGYVMFSVDNRGSSNRGLEFENAIFRQLGIEEGKDQLQGINFLKSFPYIDHERIGIHGWSFGGHMTVSMLLRYPGIFKAGVAGGPVIDWKYYEVMYGERYMDTPQTNPEGYELSNLNNLAGNLKDKLLIIHDDMDDTCVMQHTLSFMKACVNAFTFPEMFIYPGHGHNVRGHDRVHLYEKITRYFQDNL